MSFDSESPNYDEPVLCVVPTEERDLRFRYRETWESGEDGSPKGEERGRWGGGRGELISWAISVPKLDEEESDVRCPRRRKGRKVPKMKRRPNFSRFPRSHEK